MSAGPFFGKYRGTVRNNIDPEMVGQLQVEVPDVGGNMVLSWAKPCLPVGGPNMGMFSVPPIGAGVWVEFERGDPDYPIWTGVFWGIGAEKPVLGNLVPPGVSGVTLQTQLGNGIVISDVPGPTGGILLQTASGASISISDIGIVINNGRGAVISMASGPMVDVNAGALQVT
ncbi:MAG: baseplate assembly protein [Rubrivivax sp.]|nr:baseplate assembly protein [Rubrivivax sp.]